MIKQMTQVYQIAAVVFGDKKHLHRSIQSQMKLTNLQPHLLLQHTTKKAIFRLKKNNTVMEVKRDPHKRVNLNYEFIPFRN